MRELSIGAIQKYFRKEKGFPHIWCPGCGNGIILGSLLRAIERSGLKQDDIVLISGIGCSGRITVYTNFNTLHTTHGRALTFATGMKLARNSLQVIAVMGDGDALAIGGNHFIHSARRNMDLTAIVVNNSIYGMTGGQHSPTTPPGYVTTTTPYGQIEDAFNVSELAATAGAPFVCRATVYHVQLLDRLIEMALHKKGFRVVEVLSNCHVQFGRRNKMDGPVSMIKDYKDRAVSLEKAKLMSSEEMKEKITIGVLTDIGKDSYLDKYNSLHKRTNDKNHK